MSTPLAPINDAKTIEAKPCRAVPLIEGMVAW